MICETWKIFFQYLQILIQISLRVQSFQKFMNDFSCLGIFKSIQFCFTFC